MGGCTVLHSARSEIRFLLSYKQVNPKIKPLKFFFINSYHFKFLFCFSNNSENFSLAQILRSSLTYYIHYLWLRLHTYICIKCKNIRRAQRFESKEVKINTKISYRFISGSGRHDHESRARHTKKIVLNLAEFRCRLCIDLTNVLYLQTFKHD